MRLNIVGPGRAGMALALRAHAAGHKIVGVVGRDYPQSQAQRVKSTAFTLGDALPDADLTVVAVVDDAIGVVAEMLAFGSHEAVVHMSGLKPVSTLSSLSEAGTAIGAFHPAQTLPDADRGAQRLAGAWVAITTDDEDLLQELHVFARSLGMKSFDLADEAKPMYHAAAAAAANFTTVALTMASDLFDEAGVSFDAARPLVEAIVDNAFELGPRNALTGPVARGDIETVRTQIEALEDTRWQASFRDFVRATAMVAERQSQFSSLTDGHA
ncbi:MAG: DUF2520 domain-containing protein [Acidimicrobiia bacterium]|nr:DUF2520 domain-containing protein [Acidimicrobiia bacterium]